MMKNGTDPSNPSVNGDGEFPAAYRKLLVAYDAGERDSTGSEALAGECLERLEANQACLDLLHQAWPEQAPVEPAPEIEPAQALGDFRIVREIGRGGMGVVYESEQLSLGRRVALKVLPFTAVLDEKAITRFKNEARAAATLEHPNIVPVFAVGNERGVYYYAMAYIEGRTLAEVVSALRQKTGAEELASTPTSAETIPADKQSSDNQRTADVETEPQLEAALSTLPDYGSREYHTSVMRLGIQAARALHHAHERGIVHRDIKPGNLMVDTQSKLWVTDFGLARIESEAGMTVTGDLLGTLRYMAPEQADGRTSVVDQRADIYALGITLYELLALRPAFDAKKRGELLRQIEREDPPPLRKLVSAIPADLVTIVDKAIAKEPGERYDTAVELADDLERVLEHRPILAQPPGLIARIGKWSRRHVAAVWTMVAILLTVLTALATATNLVADALSVAEFERDSAVHNLYVANLRLAQREYEDSNIFAVEELLEETSPTNRSDDLRGWEWYYLNSLLHQDKLTYSDHSDEVYTAAWSPDGKMIASGGRDQLIRIWDPESGKNFATLKGISEEIVALAWRPDGKQIAALVADNSIHIWDARSFDLVLSFPIADAQVMDVAWHPDGSKIATAKFEPKVTIWDAKTGGLTQEIDAHQGMVWSLDWNPDGSRLVTAGGYHDRSVRIWNLATGQQEQVIEDAHFGAVACVHWSANGKYLATCGNADQRVRVWDKEHGNCLLEIDADSGPVRRVKWSPDDKLLATAGADGTVRIWEVSNGELLTTLRGHRRAITSIAWRPDGKSLVSTSRDGVVKVWAPHSAQNHRALGVEGFFAFSPDSKQIVSVARGDSANDPDAIRLFDLGTDRFRDIALKSPRKTSYLPSVSWSHDGKQVVAAVSDVDSQLARFDVIDVNSATYSWHAEVDLKYEHSELRALTWSTDSQFIAAAMSDSESAFDGSYVLILDGLDGEEVARLRHDAACDSMAWSPDGELIATTSWDQELKLWDTDTWREVLSFDRQADFKSIEAGGATMVAWTPDSQTVISGSAYGWIVAWDVETRRERFSFKAHTAPVRAVAISPDGSRLATGSRDRSVKLWDLQGRHLLSLEDASDSINSLKFSPDGRHLGVTYRAKSLIWTAPTLVGESTSAR